MIETLFEMPESKSPKLLWMEKYGIQTSYTPASKLWAATHGITIEFGETEIEALTDLAIHLDFKLWNQEGA